MGTIRQARVLYRLMGSTVRASRSSCWSLWGAALRTEWLGTSDQEIESDACVGRSTPDRIVFIPFQPLSEEAEGPRVEERHGKRVSGCNDKRTASSKSRALLRYLQGRDAWTGE